MVMKMPMKRIPTSIIGAMEKAFALWIRYGVVRRDRKEARRISAISTIVAYGNTMSSKTATPAPSLKNGTYSGRKPLAMTPMMMMPM